MRIIAVIFFTVGLGIVASGCASNQGQTSEAKTKSKYIYLPPETGSNIPRRVLVKDGAVQGDPSSTVNANPDSLREAQQKGSFTRQPGQ